jgi:hypothetical protein
MKFVQEQPHRNYCTADPAKIYFRRSEHREPTHLQCSRIGYELSEHCEGMSTVELAPFEFVGAGVFGAARPCDPASSTKWTGASHKYGVYKNRNQILIIESNGRGEYGYLERYSGNVRLFEGLCALLPAEQVWDICRLIVETQKQAYRKGRSEMTTLFLQNRLKRRRRNNRPRLEILPEPVPKAE